MAPKNLKIDQLKLDLHNPRIGNATDQHEAMQQVIDDQDYKLANLAENIVDNNSLNPMDRLLVLKDADGKYIVLDGNRRALALKLLANPTALTGLKVRPALQKRFEAAAVRFDEAAIEPISGFEVAERADASTWIEQRHKSEDEGRGIVGWSAEAIARFTGRDPALQALDFVRQHAELTDAEKTVLAGKFPITKTTNASLTLYRTRYQRRVGSSPTMMFRRSESYMTAAGERCTASATAPARPARVLRSCSSVKVLRFPLSLVQLPQSRNL